MEPEVAVPALALEAAVDAAAEAEADTAAALSLDEHMNAACEEDPVWAGQLQVEETLDHQETLEVADTPPLPCVFPTAFLAAEMPPLPCVFPTALAGETPPSGAAHQAPGVEVETLEVVCPEEVSAGDELNVVTAAGIEVTVQLPVRERERAGPTSQKPPPLRPC